MSSVKQIEHSVSNPVLSFKEATASVDKTSLASSAKQPEKDKYADYREQMIPAAIKQSLIYHLIIDTVYLSETSTIAWPSDAKGRIKYILLIPLTHLQFISIPRPMGANENFYPLSMFMATVWIWAYSYVIVMLTFKTTMAFNLRFCIMPLVLYSFGIALRD